MPTHATGCLVGAAHLRQCLCLYVEGRDRARELMGGWGDRARRERTARGCASCSTLSATATSASIEQERRCMRQVCRAPFFRCPRSVCFPVRACLRLPPPPLAFQRLLFLPFLPLRARFLRLPACPFDTPARLRSRFRPPLRSCSVSLSGDNALVWAANAVGVSLTHLFGSPLPPPSTPPRQTRSSSPPMSHCPPSATTCTSGFRPLSPSRAVGGVRAALWAPIPHSEAHRRLCPHCWARAVLSLRCRRARAGLPLWCCRARVRWPPGRCWARRRRPPRLGPSALRPRCRARPPRRRARVKLLHHPCPRRAAPPSSHCPRRAAPPPSHCLRRPAFSLRQLSRALPPWLCAGLASAWSMPVWGAACCVLSPPRRRRLRLRLPQWGGQNEVWLRGLKRLPPCRC